MTAETATWVAALDIDDADSLTGIDGPARPHQRRARVLIRKHGAPIGQVDIPLDPGESLPARLRTAAEASLGADLRRHAELDNRPAWPPGSSSWAAAVACPARFPTPADIGISIVVCTRDRPASLGECLSALGRIDYKPVEILVVDNAPAGADAQRLVAAVAREDVRVRYTCEPRPGLSNARNHGLRAASFDVVAFIDDDTLADPGWPAALAAGFAADPSAWCITGSVIAGALDTFAEQYFDRRYFRPAAFEPARYDLDAHRVPDRLYPYNAGLFGAGANFAVRREAVRQAGGFDPLLGAGSIGRGGEDLDMFLRVILHGGRICRVPAAVVWHRHHVSAETLDEQMYSYGHGLGAYLAKHMASRQLRVALAWWGYGHAAGLASRIYRASLASGAGPRGAGLALSEARGVLMGALRYRRAAAEATE